MPRFRLLTVEVEATLPPISNTSLEPKIVEICIESSPSWTMKDVREELEKKLKRSVSNCLFARGKQVDDNSLTVSPPSRSLTWTGVESGFRIVEALSIQMLIERGEGYRVTPALRALRDVNSTCLKGSKAMRASSGSGGVYFLKSTTPTNHIFACFKPRDDEPGSRNNPNQASVRNGVLPGEAAEREAAAFILDWDGFCGVPATILTEAACEMFQQPHNAGPRPKIGSFQHFIQNAPDTVGDFSPHLFAAREVHKIGILDLRFLNMDRNDSNILVVHKGDEYHLVPIDHGLCFPDRIEVGWCDWVWWDWPQTLVPFDQETREWVMSLDVEEDLRILQQCFGIRQECLRVYRCMMTLLKKGVLAGLTLRDIASIVVRARDIDEPSAMEKTISRATELTALMESNARNKTVSSGNSNGRIHRSSSFDGSFLPTLAGNSYRNVNLVDNGKVSSDELFFSYVNRLLEDIVAETIQRKVEPMDEQDLSDSGWFSASTRSSPSELTKIASPRLYSNGTKLSLFSAVGVNESIPSIPVLNLHQ
jgi:hypothetical protein